MAKKVRCPHCLRIINRELITKAYKRLGGLEVQRNHEYFVEIGLLGASKRTGKSLESLKKRYLRRKVRKAGAVA